MDMQVVLAIAIVIIAGVLLSLINRSKSEQKSGKDIVIDSLNQEAEDQHEAERAEDAAIAGHDAVFRSNEQRRTSEQER
jgi:hypothetical protein